MVQSAISQIGYPKKIVLSNGDTVVAITVYQVHQLNQVKIDRAECLEVSDSLNSRIDTYKLLKNAKDSVIYAQERQIQAYIIALIEAEYLYKVPSANA